MEYIARRTAAAAGFMRGLAETRHIGKVVVHPTNPDIAYVAALGNLWKASSERGVFKTTDGGRTWSQALCVDTLGVQRGVGQRDVQDR
jgi:hypothetical protein